MATKSHHIHICDIGGGAVQVCSFPTAAEERKLSRHKAKQGCPASEVLKFKGEVSPEMWELIDKIADAAFDLGSRW